MKKTKKIIIISFILLVVALLLYLFLSKNEFNNEVNNQKKEDNGQTKTVLYVNSYHEGLPWSDGILEGLKEGLSNESDVNLLTYNMDAKRNPSVEYGENEAKKIVSYVNEIDPDVLVVSDDPAFKYLVEEYYKDTEIPVVFSGINWDLERYNGPYTNTAGMVEVVLFDRSINEISSYVEGDTVGFLTEDTASEPANTKYLMENSNLKEEHVVYVNNFEEWKDQYIKLQEEVDILVVGVMGSYFDSSNLDDLEKLKSFVMKNTTKPTVSEHSWMVDFTLLSYGKLSQEQGEYSAKLVKEILEGKSPATLGVQKNKKGELAVNLKLAEILNINFRPELLKKANKIFE